MKISIYLSIIFQVLALTCWSQTIPLETWNGVTVPGNYYKDTNNRLNIYEGTYLYVNGTDSLKVVLNKKVNTTMNYVYSEDLLIGELRYVENGVEKLNTLPMLNQDNPDQHYHAITANIIYAGPDNICPDCTSSDFRLDGLFVESATKNAAIITMRKIVLNGQDSLQLDLSWQTRTRRRGAPPGLEPKLNGAVFTLKKQ